MNSTSAAIDEVDRLRGLAGKARPVTMAGDRILPVLPAMVSLFPEGGLRRGSTVAVTGSRVGVTSLALALMAQASAAGSWCGVVGYPNLGLVAAAEMGLDLERLALVPEVPSRSWLAVVGALLDAMDAVVIWPPAHLRVGDARRLSTRARDRGAVLITVSEDVSSQIGGRPWPERVDIRLTVAHGCWYGPDHGHGRFQGRQVDIESGGRGMASRSRHLTLWLPSADGSVAMVDPDAAPGPLAGSTTPAFAGSDIEAGLADESMVGDVGAMRRATGTGMAG